MKQLAWLLLIPICISCSSTNNTQTISGFWYNSNKTPEQMQEDEADCEMMRQIANQRQQVSGGLLTQIVAANSEQQRLNNISTECMLSKGYTFITIEEYQQIEEAHKKLMMQMNTPANDSYPVKSN